MERIQRKSAPGPSVRAGYAMLALGLALLLGCATKRTEQKAKEDFFTSGSSEADRRAERSVPEAKDKKDDKKLIVEEKLTLYQRLGGEATLETIVDDFLKRAMKDPRVNWTREGATKSRWFRAKKSEPWSATPENVTRLKRHFVQFLSLATGGPPEYGGRPLQAVHEGMQISKAEFDAAIGDLKATLDHFKIAPEIQKELLSIVESTRPQIAAERRR